MKKLLLLACVLLPVSAFAQDQTSVQDLCQKLENYQPSDDVEYKPGAELDADGNPIVPADLDGGSNQVQLSDSVKIAITYDQAQQLNIPGVPYTPQMYVGNAEIKKDGSVYFNGKRLTQPQVQFLCDPKVNK